MNVVVIGGGIVGFASAYYLRKRDIEVTVVEKSSIGAGSTGRANGGIREQFSSPVNVALSKESIDVWRQFEEEFDTDIQYRRPGYLFLARTRETGKRLEENVRRQNELGVSSQLLTPEETLTHCPELNADRYEVAAYNERDGFADPHLGLQGFASAAARLGATVKTGVEITDVRRDTDTGEVVGVETDEGPLSADYVVNAAGPWAKQVAALAGIELDVTPKRRQLTVVDPTTPVSESVPLTVDLDRHVHFRPERDGAAIVGGYFRSEDPELDPDAYAKTVSPEWAATAIEQASDCAAYFGDTTRFVRGWAGLYAVTPDHHPIIEETVQGFVNAVGFSGHGFMHAPATGKVVTELVQHGDASLVDVSGLTADRFERGAEIPEASVIN